MSAVLRVLVVDDSAFMVRTLKQMLESSPDIKVVGVAQNGKEAIQMTSDLKPDIITMDIEMPVMNGIEAIQSIMQSNPTPILVISTHTTDGAQVTIDALTSGAVDFILKNSAFNANQLLLMRDEIIEKVTTIGRNSSLRNQLTRQGVLKVQANKTPVNTIQTPAPKLIVRTDTVSPSVQNVYSNASVTSQEQLRKRPAQSYFKVAMIGISTGGPLSLQKLLPAISEPLPVPLLIVQHMPAKFTASLAERLNAMCKFRVKEAEHGEQLQAGTVYIAQGGMQMTVTRQHCLNISHEPSAVLYKPSVDVLAQSVLEVFGGKVLGVMMTGMGRDGADTYKLLHQAGAYIVSQNAETSVVYGMPKAVNDEGIAHEIVGLEAMAGVITQCLTSKSTTPVGVGTFA